MNFRNSPIEEINFNNQNYFIKRDDLLDVDFSGNKARKFYYFLEHEFEDITKIVSHGSAQSNAMYSLSVLAKLKNWEFEYYVNHIATYLKENPIGNYKEALNNGMKIYEDNIPEKFDSKTLFIKEGGALKEASYGIKILADEIISWAKKTEQKNLKVFLPSGTGTTALFLQKYLPFEVLTCPCVGSSEYLKKQFNALEKLKHPTIISLDKKYHFGKLYKEFYEIHNSLYVQTKIEFDLLYDSLGWLSLESYIKNCDYNNKINVLYIHQGGILGNKSMKERYLFKFK